MNIGIITHNFPFGLKDRQNAGIFVNDIAQKLVKKNKVIVYCPAGGKRKNKIGKVNVVNFPVFGDKKLGDFKLWNPVDWIRLVSFFIGGFSKLSAFVKKNKIDVNIAMWAFPSGVFSYFAKKIYKVPYITWCLGSDVYIYAKKPILKGFIRSILRNSNFVFADGIDLAREVEKLSGKRCIFVPSASKAEFRSNQIKRKTGLISLAFVGRMELVKGPDVFLEALGLIKDSLSKFMIHFIGGGLLLDKLKRRAIEIGILQQTIFYGNINDFQKISDVIRNADWLVIPSRSDSIPLVFSEAMKCGTPVISSDLQDLKYLVNKYNVGLLFKKGDSMQLASIIKKLPDLEETRKVFLKNTKIAAIDFDIQKSAEEVMFYLSKV